MSERVDTAAPEAQAAMNLSQDQLRQLAQQDLLVGATFAKIVSLLMRSPGHRGATLADLDWLVVPPLMAGQFAILDGLIDGVALTRACRRGAVGVGLARGRRAAVERSRFSG